MQRAGLIILIILIMVVPPSISAAQDLDPAGYRAGEIAGDFIKNKLNSKTKMNQRVNDPMTKDTVNLNNISDTASGIVTPFCGQGTIESKAPALMLTLNLSTNQLLVESDTNSDGILDSPLTVTATEVCSDGFKDGTLEYAWQVYPSGVVTAYASPGLNGCMNPVEVPMTYVGGKVSALYAEATGRNILERVPQGNRITYYSGVVRDCTGAQNDLGLARFYDDPYSMESAAVDATIACGGGGTSADCRAYRSLLDGSDNVSATQSGDVSCTITRNVIDQLGPANNIICEPNMVYYPNGFSNINQYCMKNPSSTWDYNQKVILRCDPFGKKLYLQGWAYWEGAPCGTEANHPPEYQVDKLVPYGTTQLIENIGRLSANRRMGGDNVSHNDKGDDVRCYSEVNPLQIDLDIVCDATASQCDYNMFVLNAPACGEQSIHVEAPAGENISNGCELYEERIACDLKSETWIDANGTGFDVVLDGQYTLNYPDETCKNFAVVGTVCEEWWSKERTYKCASDMTATPDVSRAASVLSSTQITSTTITYGDTTCATPPCAIDTWNLDQTASVDCEMSCLLKYNAAPDPKSNVAYEYEVRPCRHNISTDTYTCNLQSGEVIVTDCSCVNTFGMAAAPMAGIYDAFNDRKCR